MGGVLCKRADEVDNTGSADPKTEKLLPTKAILGVDDPDWKQKMKTWECPVRDLTGDVTWRTTKPNYDNANVKFLRQRSRKHAQGSLEHVVQDIVKNYEMEISHKVVPADWNTIDTSKFKIKANMGAEFDVAGCIKLGSYNVLLDNTKGYKAAPFEETHKLWQSKLESGFGWECLKVHTPPPVVRFSWRHWGHLGGTTLDEEAQGKGQLVELFGFSVATLDDKGKMIDLQNYYDADKFLKEVGEFQDDTEGDAVKEGKHTKDRVLLAETNVVISPRPGDDANEDGAKDDDAKEGSVSLSDVEKPGKPGMIRMNSHEELMERLQSFSSRRSLPDLEAQ